MRSANKNLSFDIGIFFSMIFLVVFGVIFVYSSSFAVAQQKFGGANFFLIRHVIRAMLGVVAFAFFFVVDYHKIGRLSKVAYLASVVMLVYILMLPENMAVNGSKRWINLGFMSFQVSEVARVVLILFLSYNISNDTEDIKEWNVFVKYLIRIGVICGLIILEPDFSTAMLTGVIGLSILFVAGAKLSHILVVFLSLVPVGIIGVIATPYRYKRLLGFLNMSGSKSGTSYQTYQSLIGLGNGRIFGVGLGHGEQKYFFLPEPHTDFVFSILGEEIGFIGLSIVLAIFLFLIYRGMKVAVNAQDKMGRLMAFGLSFVISIYVIMHAAVNTGLIPTTGVPLPFLSYGGMSLVFTMSSMGIILNISKFRNHEVSSAKRRRI